MKTSTTQVMHTLSLLLVLGAPSAGAQIVLPDALQVSRQTIERPEHRQGQQFGLGVASLALNGRPGQPAGWLVARMYGQEVTASVIITYGGTNAAEHATGFLRMQGRVEGLIPFRILTRRSSVPMGDARAERLLDFRFEFLNAEGSALFAEAFQSERSNGGQVYWNPEFVTTLAFQGWVGAHLRLAAGAQGGYRRDSNGEGGRVGASATARVVLSLLGYFQLHIQGGLAAGQNFNINRNDQPVLGWNAGVGIQGHVPLGRCCVGRTPFLILGAQFDVRQGNILAPAGDPLGSIPVREEWRQYVVGGLAGLGF